MNQQTTRASQQTASPYPHHGRPSLPTAEITLSPAFLEALRKVAPTSRRGRAPFALLALAAVVLCVALVPRARQGVLATANRLLDRDAAAATAAPPANPPTTQAAAPPPATATAAPAPVVPTVAAPAVVSVDDLPSNAPAPKAAKSKKAPKKSRGRATR